MESNDHEIVEALLRHDALVTREFFYRKCYPLFKSVFDNYQTDCATTVEFINEIYVHLLEPDRETGHCKLQGFHFRCTLFTWLKTVCLFYCYKRYKRQQRVPMDRISDDFDDGGVRIDRLGESINSGVNPMSATDVATILRLMPNRRYSRLIELRYVSGHTNEETARIMGMNMNTYYNKHKMAKEQFLHTLRKEDFYG